MSPLIVSIWARLKYSVGFLNHQTNRNELLLKHTQIFSLFQIHIEK